MVRSLDKEATFMVKILAVSSGDRRSLSGASTPRRSTEIVGTGDQSFEGPATYGVVVGGGT
jgi:hypothetical protein